MCFELAVYYENFESILYIDNKQVAFKGGNLRNLIVSQK